MRQGLLLAAIVATAGLTGCIGDAGDGSIGSTGLDDTNATETVSAPLGLLPDGAPVPTNVTLEGCNDVLSIFPVPMAFAEGDAPDGFALVAFDDAGVFATLLAISFTCTVDGESVTELYGAFAVEPPEALRHPDPDALHLATFAAITTSEHLLDVYEAWSVAAVVDYGEVEVTTAGMAPARYGEVTASVGADGGEFQLYIETVATGPEEVQDAGVARAFVVEDGQVVGAMDVGWTESAIITQGTATFTGVPPSIPMAAMPGIAVHSWGDDYDLWYEYVDLSLS